jgi:O-antigen ligase
LIFGYLLLFIILVRGPIEKTDKENYEKIFFAAGIFLIIYGIYQRFILYPRLEVFLQTVESPIIDIGNYTAYIKRHRILGFYISPNIFAIIPLMFTYNYLKKLRLGYILFTITFLIMLYLTRSFNLIIFFTILLFSCIKRKYWKLIIISITVVIIILFLSRRSSFQDGSIANPIKMRIKNYHSAVNIFFRSPFIGHGISSFKDLYPKFKIKGSNDIKYTHNIILQHLCDGGVIFLLLFLYLIYTIYKKLPANERYFPTAILVHNLFSFSFYSSSVFLLFFVYYYIYKNKNHKENYS